MRSNTKITKILVLACSLILLVTTFIGCGSGSGTKDTTPTTTSEKSSTPAENAQKQDAFAKHLKFTMSAIDADKAGKAKDGSVAGNYDWFCKKFNIEFEFVPVTWDNYIDQTRLWLASGDAPDLMMLDIAPTRYPEFLSWVKQELFKPYPDLSKYPNLKEKMDKMITGKKFVVDGKLYAWPAYIDLDKYNWTQISLPVYRRDWARKVGLLKENDEYTWDEWYTLVKTVVEKDLAGNKKTIGMIGNDWCFPKFFGPGNLSPYMLEYVKGSDGKWIWGPMLPESLEAIKLTRKMYDEGLIYKDQIMIKNDTVTTKFDAGLVFASYGGNVTVDGLATTTGNLKKAVPELDTAKDIGVAFVKGPNGKILCRHANDQWSQEAMNAKLSDEKVERWCAALDYMVSEEGYYFRQAGIPQQDWTLENGQLKINWKEWPYGDGTWSWTRAASCADGYALINPAKEQYVRDIVRKSYERLQQPDVDIINLNVDLSYFTAPNYDKIGNKEREIYQEIAKLMVSKNLEKDWNDWVKSKEAEINPVLAELNEKLK